MSRPRLAVLLAALSLAAALVAFLVVEPWLEAPAAGPEPVVAGDVAGAITFELRERNGSGRFGFVTLEPVEGGTRVGIDLGPGAGAPLPAHVHEGTCARPGALVEELSLVLARAGPDGLATSFTTVRSELEELRAGEKIVDVHASESRDAIVACVAVGE